MSLGTAEGFLPDTHSLSPVVGDLLPPCPTPLRNPVLRNTLARVMTEQACRRENIDMLNLLAEHERMVDNEKVLGTPVVSITRTDGPTVNLKRKVSCSYVVPSEPAVNRRSWRPG